MNKIPRNLFRQSARWSNAIQLKHNLYMMLYCTVCDEQFKPHEVSTIWDDDYIILDDWVYILPKKKHPKCYEMFCLNPMEYETYAVEDE